MDKNFNAPSEVVQPEAWAYGITDEDADIHMAEHTQDDTEEVNTMEQIEDNTQGQITVMEDENSDDDEISDLQEVVEQLDPDSVEELNLITEDDGQGEGEIRVQDTEENRLIVMATTESFSRSGGKRVTKVFCC